ncbi:hypothetical protein LIA77_04376 [Sarocladium implicatum]|nr:hypothetical protein LIA77_04376 [Sarocladium implicatum]
MGEGLWPMYIQDIRVPKSTTYCRERQRQGSSGVSMTRRDVEAEDSGQSDNVVASPLTLVDASPTRRPATGDLRKLAARMQDWHSIRPSDTRTRTRACLRCNAGCGGGGERVEKGCR